MRIQIARIALHFGNPNELPGYKKEIALFPCFRMRICLVLWFCLIQSPFTTAVSLGARFLWASCMLKSDLGRTPVKFFLDTADPTRSKRRQVGGALAGVTTNPTLYSRIGGKLADFHDHIARICEIVDGPVSAESVAMTRDESLKMVANLQRLHQMLLLKFLL